MSNSQKIPFATSQQNLIQNSIDDKLQGLGQIYPATVVTVQGAIVTVKFDINNLKFTPPTVQCSTIGPRYIRTPLRAGDQGICITADTRLGGITGLGLGVAPLVNVSNLGALVFLPIGNINWEQVDGNAVVLTAPNGVSFKTDNANTQIIASQSQILLQYGNNSIIINSSGITINGSLTINGTPYMAHTHSGVSPGGSNTGGVN